MSAMLDHVMDEIRKLSLEELQSLQRQLIDEVHLKVVPLTQKTDLMSENSTRSSLVIPQAYRRKPEEIEATLLTVFSPEQLASMKDVDLSNLGPGN